MHYHFTVDFTAKAPYPMPSVPTNLAKKESDKLESEVHLLLRGIAVALPYFEQLVLGATTITVEHLYGGEDPPDFVLNGTVGVEVTDLGINNYIRASKDLVENVLVEDDGTETPLCSLLPPLSTPDDVTSAELRRLRTNFDFTEPTACDLDNQALRSKAEDRLRLKESSVVGRTVDVLLMVMSPFTFEKDFNVVADFFEQRGSSIPTVVLFQQMNSMNRRYRIFSKRGS